MDAEDAIEAEGLSAQSGEAGVSGDSAAVARLAEFEALAVPELELTGHAEVDAALERLRELAERPTGAHPDLYDGVHQRLQDVLAQIDHQDAGR